MIFRELAPRYLDRLKKQSPGGDIRFSLPRLENDRLAFSTNDGVRRGRQWRDVAEDMPWSARVNFLDVRISPTGASGPAESPAPDEFLRWHYTTREPPATGRSEHSSDISRAA